MLFEDVTKIAFRDGKWSFVFQLVKMGQGLVTVINGDRQTRDVFAPNLEGVSEPFEFSTKDSGCIRRVHRFVPRDMHNIHETRVKKPIRLEPENLTAWYARFN